MMPILLLTQVIICCCVESITTYQYFVYRNVFCFPGKTPKSSRHSKTPSGSHIYDAQVNELILFDSYFYTHRKHIIFSDLLHFILNKIRDIANYYPTHQY